MNGRTLGVVAVVVLLVGTVPTGALAQSGPRPVLLNQNTEHVATVTVDGQRYEVYRYDNVVSFASGIDIYANGERVTEESRAQAVVTALAQRRAVEELGRDDARRIRASARAVNATVGDVSTAAAEIDATLAYVERTKSVRANGTTVYNASVEAAPALTEFNETARATLPALRSLENDSTAYVRNATALADLLQRRRNGSDVDPQRVYDRYEATLTAKYRVSQHFGYDGTTESLAEIAALSDRIAANVSTVPERGQELSRRFATVHEASARAANRTRTLDLSAYELSGAQNRADELESAWMEQWRSRRNAASDVYKTVAAAGLLVAGVGYVGWRRY
ncbi:MAG: hypothetical protein ABEJ61_00720 [Haloferacaceae archaeon]